MNIKLTWEEFGETLLSEVFEYDGSAEDALKAIEGVEESAKKVIRAVANGYASFVEYDADGVDVDDDVDSDVIVLTALKDAGFKAVEYDLHWGLDIW